MTKIKRINELIRKYLFLLFCISNRYAKRLYLFLEEKGIIDKINSAIIFLRDEILEVSDYLKKNKSVRNKLIFSITAFSVILIVWSFFFNILYSRHKWDDNKDKTFQIREGKNLSEIAEEMADSNVVASARNLKIAAKLKSLDEKIIAGIYTLKPGMNNIEILELITDAEKNKKGKKFTVAEGLRYKNIGKLAEKELALSSEKFIEASKNDSLLSIIGLQNKLKNLEGFLFPDTYIVTSNIDEKGLVNIMFEGFMKKVFRDSVLNKYFIGQSGKLYEIITLASIIQAEAAFNDEMPRIAGVYMNRINKRMKLQADPTIQYILPDGPRRLLFSDLKIESPYNTYLYLGLPPGPINNPGLDAIRAAINPEKHEYLFFVAQKDRRHRFTKTYEEHQKAINDIRNRK